MKNNFAYGPEHRSNLPTCDGAFDYDHRGEDFHVHVIIADEREFASMNWPDWNDLVVDQTTATELPKTHIKVLLKDEPGVACIKS